MILTSSYLSSDCEIRVDWSSVVPHSRSCESPERPRKRKLHVGCHKGICIFFPLCFPEVAVSYFNPPNLVPSHVKRRKRPYYMEIMGRVISKVTGWSLESWDGKYSCVTKAFCPPGTIEKDDQLEGSNTVPRFSPLEATVCSSPDV